MLPDWGAMGRNFQKFFNDEEFIKIRKIDDICNILDHANLTFFQFQTFFELIIKNRSKCDALQVLYHLNVDLGEDPENVFSASNLIINSFNIPIVNYLKHRLMNMHPNMEPQNFSHKNENLEKKHSHLLEIYKGMRDDMGSIRTILTSSTQKNFSTVDGLKSLIDSALNISFQHSLTVNDSINYFHMDDFDKIYNYFNNASINGENYLIEEANIFGLTDVTQNYFNNHPEEEEENILLVDDESRELKSYNVLLMACYRNNLNLVKTLIDNGCNRDFVGAFNKKH